MQFLRNSRAEIAADNTENSFEHSKPNDLRNNCDIVNILTAPRRVRTSGRPHTRKIHALEHMCQIFN